MLETELKRLFERQAAAEQPPTRLSIQAAYLAARRRLRIRRLAAIATPAIAAGAVAAIVLTTSGQVSHPSPAGPGHRQHPTHHAQHLSAPESFDPLHPYLTFGWLPPRTTVVSGQSGTTAQYLNAEGPGGATWMLSAYSAGQCRFARLHLRCARLGPRSDVVVASRLPDIGGRPAYRIGPSQSGGELIWQYARDGWARLDFMDSADAVRIADHVIFGGPSAPLRFQAQLTGMPGWQLKFATFNLRRGGLLATIFGFASGAALHAPGPEVPLGYPEIQVSDASPSQRCDFTAGKSTRTVVAGFRVVITTVPEVGVTVHDVCAASADKLAVDVTVSGNRLAAAATTIFAHLRLFGPDPARWTTQPIG